MPDVEVLDERVARIAIRAAKNQREPKATRKNAGTDCKRC